MLFCVCVALCRVVPRVVVLCGWFVGCASVGTLLFGCVCVNVFVGVLHRWFVCLFDCVCVFACVFTCVLCVCLCDGVCVCVCVCVCVVVFIVFPCWFVSLFGLFCLSV